MGIQFPESPRDMKFLLLAALCASVLSLPQGRKLRPEEHWRPSQVRDLSKYKPRHPQVAAGSFDIEMEKINKVAAEMRASGKFSKSNKKDKGQPRAECGIEGPTAKIVGGEEATPHTWPWQVALFIDNAWFCGGSIISENYVLTAAHCADGASYFDVMAGAHNIRDDENDRVEITSYNGWTHPGWNPQIIENDLALIELPEPVPMNNIISTSCLPNKGEVIEVGSLTTVTGWGLPSDSAGGISPVLREVRDIPVMDSAPCNDYYGIINDGIVCIDTTGGRGSCNGDSGGPLVQKAGQKGPGQKWTQVGIVSFGSIEGCESGRPDGFTRTEYYIDWINSETGLE